MVFSILALLILLASFWLIATNIRSVLMDTFEVARDAAMQCLDPSRALSGLAFIGLWGLIFWLSFA